MEEDLDEEISIMEESTRPLPVFSAEMLELPVATLCKRPAELLDASATVGDAIARMQKARFSAVVVVEDGKVAGIVTERDILMKVCPGDRRSEPVTAIMTPNPECLRKEDMIAFVMNKMYVGGYRHVPIVDENGAPTHVIALRTVLQFILEHFPREIVNIASEPYRGERKVWSG